MKKILIIFSALLLNTFAFAAGSDSGGSEETLYNDAVKLIKRAGKLEKKNKPEKAGKLYSQAFKKLEEAFGSDKKKSRYFKLYGIHISKSRKFF